MSLKARSAALRMEMAAARAPHDRRGHIDATGRQIDRLVWALQGLTEDEIRIVEEAAG